MTIQEKIKQIKYNRSSSLEKFMIDVEKYVSSSPCSVNQEFRDKFANGSMVLTIESIVGGITLDQIPGLIDFIEINFGIKYTYKI